MSWKTSDPVNRATVGILWRTQLEETRIRLRTENMSNECDQFYKWSGTLRRLLLFSGIWPSIHTSIRFRLLGISHGLILFVMTSAIFNFSYSQIRNINLFLSAIISALSYVTTIVKLVCLTYYREDLIDLHTSLDVTFREDLDDVLLRPILLSPLFLIYRPMSVMMLVLVMMMMMFLTTPAIVIAIQLSKGVRDLKYSLPFPSLYPWRYDTSNLIYELHYAFELWGGIIVATITIAVDTLFGYYIFQISGQLRTLSYRLETVKSEENYRKVLSECVIRHQILKKCEDHLERIYGPVVLWQSTSSAMVICALIYELTHMSAAKTIVFVLYITMKAMQTFLYGWLGSFLTTENELFRDAIYASDWAGSGEKCFMTNILIMLNHNKLVVLKACSVTTISVEMFVTICNTALSYYFMLRTLEDAHKF